MLKNEYNEIAKSLPSNFRMRLEQISMFLSQGKASVMVGAGFSKNAQQMEFAQMKDWGELTRIFYEQLFFGEDRKKNEIYLYEPLKLAQMYESSFGRNALDTLIQNSLHNESIVPGRLHKMLMKLHWKDVFTTNYDTLLENAALESERGYQIVTNKDTLLYAQSPRIVKLHGSFPNIRPYIITEEDFRTYPQQYPEFVNTVRQALMESLFCLIGFSGNDPNFLQWIGWLRDVMGNQVSPAYLITYEPNLHKAQVDLFKGRGIEIINLAELKEGISYSEGLEFVLDYLNPKHKEHWNPEVNIPRITSVDDVVEATKIMMKIRERYPQYLYLPKDLHQYFADIDPFPNGIDKSVLEQLSLSQKIRFIYEIVWRYEVSLSPVLIDWILTEMEILSFMQVNCDPMDVHYLLEIQLALLTILRVNGEDNRFEELVEILEKWTLSSAQRHKLYYEQCLQSLSLLDYKKVRELLLQWDVNANETRSALWKAVVLSEIGQYNEAINLLNLTNQRFRQSLLTQGFYQQIAITYSNAIEEALSLLEKPNPIDTSLVSLKEYFIAKLSDAEKKPSTTYENTHKYGINRVQMTWHLGTNLSSRILYSYKYVRLVELAGYPLGHTKFVINEEWLNVATSALFEVFPIYAFRSLIRSRSKKTTLTCFNRKNVLSLPIDWADKQYAIYQSRIDEYLRDDSPIAYARKIEDVLLPAFAHLAPRLNIGLVQDLREQYLKCYNQNRRGYDKSLYDVILNSLFAQGSTSANFDMFLSVPETEIRRLPWSSKWIKMTLIHDKVIESMITYLDSYNDEDKNIEMDRLWYLLSADLNALQRARLEDAVRHWRCKPHTMKVAGEILWSYTKVKDKRQEDTANRDKYLQKVVGSISELDVSSISTNTVLYKFRDDCNRLICFAHMLTNEQVEMIIMKFYNLLVHNESLLKNDDSQSFFGGFRGELHRLIIQFTKFIVNSDLRDIGRNQLQVLRDVCVRYLDYNVATICILAKIEKYTESINSDLLYEYIETKLIKGSDYERIEALQAIKIVDSALRNKLVKVVLDYVRYVQTIKTSDFIDTISDLIVAGKLSRSVWKKRIDSVLLSIANSIADLVGEEELRMDVMHATNMLAGIVDAKWGETAGTRKWKAITNDRTQFNDVRIAFDLGQSRVIENKDELFEKLILKEE